jgi:hypothetical protein
LLNCSFRDYLKSALDSEERISWGYCLSFWKNKLDWKKKNKEKLQQKRVKFGCQAAHYTSELPGGRKPLPPKELPINETSL